MLFEIGRASQAPHLAVAGRIGDAQQERFDLLDVTRFANKVQAEAIPPSCMSVPLMPFDSTVQILRQADIVKSLVLVERVNAVL